MKENRRKKGSTRGSTKEKERTTLKQEKELIDKEALDQEKPKKTKMATKTKNRIWLILNIFFTSIYLIWRIFFTIPLGYGWVSIIAGVALLIVEFLGMLEASVHYFNMHKIENHELPVVPTELYPDVDIFIATYSEPEELLYKTVNGCLHMDYPDKSKVHIYLCDDGKRPEIKALAERKGIHYFDREDNKGAKAGNLNNALSKTSAPLVVTLDADMIPTKDFLMHTVPYFVDYQIKHKDEDELSKQILGFVQTPQSFYNPDLFQFNLFSEGRIPNEQDYFYKDIQVSRNKTNSVIYGGSNTILSRAALEAIDGFYMDAITEDFATGILLQKEGFICYAINEVLASGLSATDLKSLIQQRIRWGRGVVSTARKMHILLSTKLSFGQKINYWASTWYWYAPLKRLIYIMSPILFATFGYMVVKCTLLEVLIFWLPMYISSNISLRMMSRNIRTIKWTSVYETVMFPFMLFPILLETFGISLKKFKVTKKGDVEDETGKNFVYMIPFLILIILSVIGVVKCVISMYESSSVNPIVVLFWLLVNLFSLVMSLFFVQGRRPYRKCERVQARVDCVIRDELQTVTCQTMDFSETGLSVGLNVPVDFDDDEELDIDLKTDRYHAMLKAKVVHVDRMKDIWKYAFFITDMCGTYDDYLEILYDREPTLPTNLDESLSSFDDLRINVAKRTKESFFENRKLARVPINSEMNTTDGKSVYVVNFNYKYMALKGTMLADSMTIVTQNKLEFVCKYEREVHSAIKLYAVENYGEIHNDPTRRALLKEWIEMMLKSENTSEEVVESHEKEDKNEETESAYID